VSWEKEKIGIRAIASGAPNRAAVMRFASQVKANKMSGHAEPFLFYIKRLWILKLLFACA